MARGRHSIRMAAFALTALAGWSQTATAQPYHRDSFAIFLAPAGTPGDAVTTAAALCQRLASMILRHHAVAIADRNRLIALVPAALHNLVDPDPLTAPGHFAMHAVLGQAATADDLPPDGNSLVALERRSEGPTAYRLAAEPVITRTQVLSAEATVQLDQPALNLRFDDAGTREFADHTAAHVGEPVAVVLDGEVISAPVIRERIAGGSITISGIPSHEEASLWAAILDAPPLETTLERTDFLALDSLKTALQAGEIQITTYDACSAR